MGSWSFYPLSADSIQECPDPTLDRGKHTGTLCLPRLGRAVAQGSVSRVREF